MTQNVVVAALAAACATVLVGSSAVGQEASLLSRFAFEDSARTHFELPKALREISGLATLTNGLLLAHADEEGTVFAIGPGDGSVRFEFALGDERVRADFEGIATMDSTVYLVSSDGRLFEAALGSQGERVLYNTYGTPFGRACELEGLAADAGARILFVLCKRGFAERADSLTVFAWSVDARRPLPDAFVSMPIRDVARLLGEDDLRPSGIELDLATGHFIIVAARESALVEVSRRGELIGVHDLRAMRHRQAEGVTIGVDGSLFIADEGDGKRGRITRYPPVVP